MATGNIAVLTKRSRKPTKLATEERVSGFLVLMPTARNKPDQASPKKTTVTKISRIPESPVTIVTPISIATTIIMIA